MLFFCGDRVGRRWAGGRSRIDWLRQAANLAFLVLAIPPYHGMSQDLPHTFREFLAGFQGKEILLLDYSPDMREFGDPDSLLQYLAVLESVNENEIIIRRIAGSDRRSLTYSLTDVRRITYLFNGRPYRRVVVETQEPGH